MTSSAAKRATHPKERASISAYTSTSASHIHIARQRLALVEVGRESLGPRPMSQPCAPPQLRCSPSQQQQLQQQRQRRSGCSAARLLVAPVARHAGQGARATHSGLGVVRLVAAAIPVRYNTSAGHTEVCLVNSSKGAGLVLPKVRPLVCVVCKLGVLRSLPDRGIFVLCRVRRAAQHVWSECCAKTHVSHASFRATWSAKIWTQAQLPHARPGRRRAWPARYAAPES
jgi:hypothetical protein